MSELRTSDHLALRAIGDHMQSEASRLAKWAHAFWREYPERVPYEVGMAIVGLESAIEDWTEARAKEARPPCARHLAATANARAERAEAEVERLAAENEKLRVLCADVIDSLDEEYPATKMLSELALKAIVGEGDTHSWAIADVSWTDPR